MAPGPPREDRYDRLRRIAWWDHGRVRAARVLVAGAGAIGNEVLKNLALVGVGTVHVVDLDRVEESNLSRSVLFRPGDRGHPKAEAACDAVRSINPDVQAIPHPGDLTRDVGTGLIAACDLAIGALDNREARLWLNRAAWRTSRPWIDGGIQELAGAVKVYVPPDGACYECTMTRVDYALVAARYSCSLLPREGAARGLTPTTPTAAAIVGGIAVQEALKLLHGLPSAAGHAIRFEGSANVFRVSRLPRRADCLAHETWPALAGVPLSAARSTGADLLAAAALHLGASPGDVRIHLDRDLVTALECRACSRRLEMLRLRDDLGETEARCPGCGGPSHPEMVHHLGREGLAPAAFGDATLARLGIAPFDGVRVDSGGREGYLLLEGDRQAVLGGG